MTIKPGTRCYSVTRKAPHHPTWLGTLLSPLDPRAWAGSFAFASDTPNPLEVACHVAECRSQGLLSEDQAPVLWDFADYQIVHWDRTTDLRTCFA